MSNQFSRRDLLKSSAVAGLGLFNFEDRFVKSDLATQTALNGKVNHSACRWCYQTIPFEELVVNAKKIGLTSIDLTGPEEG